MSREKAEILLEKLLAIEFQNEEEEIQMYNEVIALDETWNIPYYNLGLIYKYRKDWQKSFDYNLKAVTLNPDDEPSQWNLGIAATALKKWRYAKTAWLKFGVNFEINDEEINENFGTTPIRLLNDEVVWATRICPARARIDNIPLKDSGHNYNDLILNDGAPNGTRVHNEKEYSVFDELEILEKSNFTTYSLGVKVNDYSDIEKLFDLCEEKELGFENWTKSVRILCKQCSEGTPHENHDEELEQPNENEFNIAIASTSKKTLDEVLNKWEGKTLWIE
jgi:tetratricopeptide (TPR) repeat protein